MSKVNFYTADKGYSLKDKTKIKNWINTEVGLFNKTIEEINIVFCSDEYLLELNKKFLNHFDFTDVITFDNSDDKVINGEIYISVDRVKENAKIFKVPAYNEFLRVIIHGCLHLIGFNDHTEKEKLLMRDKENEALQRLKNT